MGTGIGIGSGSSGGDGGGSVHVECRLGGADVDGLMRDFLLRKGFYVLSVHLEVLAI